MILTMYPTFTYACAAGHQSEGRTRFGSGRGSPAQTMPFRHATANGAKCHLVAKLMVPTEVT